jgi:hypothetical protein
MALSQYFVLDWNGTETIVGHVHDANSLSLGNKYTRGAALATENQPIDLTVRVEVAPPGDYPDYFTLQQIPIASKLFVAALRSLAANFEAFPTRIFEIESGRSLDGFFVLNVVGRVAALDEQASQVTFVKNRIFRMRKLVLDLSKARDLDLFRLDQFPLAVIVSERVRDAVQSYRGVSLLPAQGWTDSVWF